MSNLFDSSNSTDAKDLENPSPYKMTVDLNVFEHLGISLYSNLAAVLTEAVANSWDADATQVNIFVNKNDSSIEIVDNGNGMSLEDINNKYLRIGYKCREDIDGPAISEKFERPLMGRKGLGKLSLMSIADCIELQTIKGGTPRRFQIKVKDLEKSAKGESSIYYPMSLDTTDINLSVGTKIILTDLKKTRIIEKALRKRLARRFSIIGKNYNFSVSINDEEITVKDREDLQSLQFLWKIGNYEPDQDFELSVLEQYTIEDSIVDGNLDWQVNGWVGTSKKPQQLKSKESGAMNGIVVLARGRLIHENILDKLYNAHLYSDYLTGQIQADFLDSDDDIDIATSDRQRLQEDDPRFDKLIEFLESTLKNVEKMWTEWRNKHSVKEAKAHSPGLDLWLNHLPIGHKKSGEKLVEKLSTIRVNNQEDRKLLLRHGILAFERMKLTEEERDLVSNIENIPKLLEMFSDRDAYEASLYCDIVKSRLETIKNIQKFKEENAREKVIQEYLFNHLWLLDPAWNRVDETKRMETTLTKELAEGIKLTKEERRTRVDIVYRTYVNKHVIVELKRGDRTVSLIELQKQGQDYYDKLEKLLINQGYPNPEIEVIFVLGKNLKEQTTNPKRIKASMSVISPGKSSRIL